MSWFATLFEFGGLAFWILLGLASVLLAVMVEFEHNGLAFLTVGVTLALLYFGGNSGLFPWIAAHPVQLILTAVGYVLVGTVWSVMKWTLLVKDRKEAVLAYRDTWLKEHPGEDFKDHLKWFKQKWNFENEYALPDPRTHKARILNPTRARPRSGPSKRSCATAAGLDHRGAILHERANKENTVSVVCKMPRPALLEDVKKNRETHVKDLAEARAGYATKMVADLNKAIAVVQSGEQPNLYDLVSKNPWPTSHVESYDRAIAMFERSVDDHVVLDATEYARLVDDQWEWKSDFTRVSNSYKG